MNATRTALPFPSVRLNDAFLGPRLETLARVTLPVAIRHCEETPRIANFRHAAAKLRGEPHGPHQGIYFDDSDVYKVLEGMAYVLAVHPDATLEAKADEWINAICAAQEPDGYLDTYFTLEQPDAKWTDMEKHEDYCAGHFFEAAVAYWRATGKRKVLDTACRLADHMRRTLKEAGRHWAVGHAEPEIGLVKLYQATGDRNHLDLALWLIEERGHGHGKGEIWNKPEWGPPYCQDDVPVRDLERVTGHAVRAMYYYAGIADVAAETGDSSLEAPLHRLWAHTVERNLYVTGGIGPSKHNEGFTEDYDLPNQEAYCETCAAIALLFWAHRMHILTGKASYVDVMERALYNNILAGISLSGDRFFYVNPLASDGTHHRQAWFGCACCPSNLARFLPSLPGYLYTHGKDFIHVNLYAGGTAVFELACGNIALDVATEYPWKGEVAITMRRNPWKGTNESATSGVRSVDDLGAFSLHLRVPAWCRSWSLTVNGQPVEATCSDGYIVLSRSWREGDRLQLSMDMPAEMIVAHPAVAADAGMACVARGPVVYCAEGMDQSEGVDAVALAPHPSFQTQWLEDRLGGIVALSAAQTGDTPPVRLIPYHVWDNREPCPMRIWFPVAHPHAAWRNGSVDGGQSSSPEALYLTKDYPLVP